MIWCAVLAAILSALFCGLMVRIGPLDRPDGKRKMQVRAVPSAGGIAIALAAVTATGVISLNLPRPASADILQGLIAAGVLPHAIFVLACLIIGAVDDIFGMPARVKFLLLSGFCLFAVTMGLRADAIHVPGAGILPFPQLAAIMGSAAWLLVIVNAVNFMDGSDGLAAGSLIAPIYVLLGLTSFAAMFGGVWQDWYYLLFALGLSVAGAIAGFLCWNMSGRLFMGDAGSLMLGALAGSLSLIWVKASALRGEPGEVWLPVLVLLPFLIDVLMTLIWRSRRSERLFEPHRHHAYQLLRRSGWKAWSVALLWWAFSAVCAAFAMAPPAIFHREGEPFISASFWSFCVLTVLGIGLWIWQRKALGRRLEREGK